MVKVGRESEVASGKLQERQRQTDRLQVSSCTVPKQRRKKRAAGVHSKV